jgi:hypothetical protein
MEKGVKLLVDFTNHNGRRALRPVMLLEQPPFSVHRKTFQVALNVSMLDKGGARRSLEVNNIHSIQNMPENYGEGEI